MLSHSRDRALCSFARDKVIPPWAERRLDGAALLRAATSSTSSTSSTSAPPILICGGGSPHGLPVLDESTGQVVHEGTAYAEYLIDVWGLPASSILKESSSYDTVGNGYFSAMIHAVPAGWKRVAVVTSEFHMPRSRAIFETVYELVYRSLSVRIELEFVSVRDEGVVDGGVREVRVEKEAKSLETWRRNMEAIDDLPAFHAWWVLFTETTRSTIDDRRSKTDDRRQTTRQILDPHSLTLLLLPGAFARSPGCSRRTYATPSKSSTCSVGIHLDRRAPARRPDSTLTRATRFARLPGANPDTSGSY